MDAMALDATVSFASSVSFGGAEERAGGCSFAGRTEILRFPHSLLAVTPQSRFADVRERPEVCWWFPALLATRRTGGLRAAGGGVCFLGERLPEILVRFGTPTSIGSGSGKHSA